MLAVLIVALIATFIGIMLLPIYILKEISGKKLCWQDVKRLYILLLTEKDS